MRAGEDTVVNMALSERGYRTWRAQDVTMIHHSPCVTPPVLLRHHFKRGRGLGRIILAHWAPGLPPAWELRYYLLAYLPGRAGVIGASVRRWGSRRDRARYALAFPLVLSGALASWVGTWWELLTGGVAQLRQVPATARFAPRFARSYRRISGRCAVGHVDTREEGAAVAASGQASRDGVAQKIPLAVGDAEAHLARRATAGSH
jgi:hypothetical protein